MHSELIQKCNQHIQDTGISQVKLAGKIGISESTFSRWFKGNYPNPEAMDVKVATFFEKLEARSITASVDDLEFANTTISDKIIGGLEYCRIQKTIGVIYGDAGIGKTYTSQDWMKDKNDVIAITINPTSASPRPFLKQLAKHLKTSKAGGTDDIMIEVIEKLEISDMTIVIDEAQHLTMKTLEIIRSINDATGTAIILIGNEAVYAKLVGKQQTEFAQLFSRLGMRIHLLTDFFLASDVESVFDIKDKEVVGYLLKICRSKYGLRGAVFVFTNSQNNNDISLNGLRAMASVMGINV